MSNYERDELQRQEAEQAEREEKAWSTTGSQKKTIGTRSPQYEPTLRYDDPDFKKGPGDPVNHPSHYTFSKIEVLDAIEEWGLDYHSGNIVKYIVRADKKDPDKLVEDLRKAKFYLERLIRMKQEKQDKNEVHGIF